MNGKTVDYTNLVGKYIAYYDGDLKRRCGKVVRINGTQSVTIKNVYNERHRIKREKILGQETRKSGIISIDWGS